MTVTDCYSKWLIQDGICVCFNWITVTRITSIFSPDSSSLFYHQEIITKNHPASHKMGACKGSQLRGSQRGFVFQPKQLNWKSSVCRCTTLVLSAATSPPACQDNPGCLLLNIDGHLECHSSAIKLGHASEVGPALLSVCRTQMQRWGVWHHCTQRPWPQNQLLWIKSVCRWQRHRI